MPARKVAIEQRWSGDPDEFTAGIPQTRTLRVEVEGVLETQIPDLHVFETDSLQQYGDQPELVREGGADGTRAVRTERFAVIAQSAGLLTVPAVEMPWFNVVNRAWEVARIEPREVTVLPSRELGAEADPAPAAAASPVDAADTGLQLWQGVSAALLTGWLLTLLLWWHNSRLKRAEVRRRPRCASAGKRIAAAFAARVARCLHS